jgi:hypothetical protein
MSDTEIASGDILFKKEPYALPEPGCMYSVRDKRKGERVVRVVDVSEDHREVQVEVLKDGHAATEPVPVAVDALNRQAEKGWCSRLKPVDSHEEAPDVESQPAASNPTSTAEMRLDTQHFHRCCAEIVRANIRFDTHVIREIGDGAFRAGNYEQAFQKFEQISIMFTTAVANSRRAIADGRRDLAAAKLKLSGREFQERTAGYARNEQLINTAEREFSKILEGLRLCVQAQQVNTNASPSTSP